MPKSDCLKSATPIISNVFRIYYQIRPMIAQIITIGDEILIGQTIDTNSAWLAQNLEPFGIKVGRILSISDEKSEILSALKGAIEDSGLVIITGGLGPTRDDITKSTLAEFFGSNLVRNREIESRIVEMFQKYNRPVLEVNRQQADLPANCTILNNPLGTAAGMLWDINATKVLSMPGVPYEMKAIFTESFVPILERDYKANTHLLHMHVLTVGIGESSLAHKISDWEDRIRAAGFQLAYLPNPGQVKLRISYYGSRNPDEVKTEMRRAVDELKELIPKYFVGEGGANLPQIIADKMLECNQKLGVVESCTGGYLARGFTSMPGCSEYFMGGLVAYDNDIKTRVLGVDEQIIRDYGAVSEACVGQMAERGRELLQVDYCLATSGVAGPEGGSVEKPVGLVCMAIAGPEGVKTWKNHFPGDRQRVVERCTTELYSEFVKMLSKHCIVSK